VIAANVDQVVVVFAVARPEPHLRMLDRFLVLCESTEDAGLFVLVSKSDPCIQLAVVEAKLVMPDYPVREASIAADFEHEEAAVALVVTQGSGDQPSTVNLQAPVVMGLSSRHGRQVILLREDLPLRHTITLPIAPPVAKTP
jgi:flagellar assembly factor FliW